MKQYIIDLHDYNIMLRGQRVFALECVSDTSLLGYLLYRLGRPRMWVTYLDGNKKIRQERVDKRLVTPIAATRMA